jgi:hypothetical protein
MPAGLAEGSLKTGGHPRMRDHRTWESMVQNIEFCEEPCRGGDEVTCSLPNFSLKYFEGFPEIFSVGG